MRLPPLVAMAYFIALGYVLKKYEVPARIGNAILDGTGTLAHIAGKEFSRGMVDVPPVPEKMITDLFPNRDKLLCP